MSGYPGNRANRQPVQTMSGYPANRANQQSRSIQQYPAKVQRVVIAQPQPQQPPHRVVMQQPAQGQAGGTIFRKGAKLACCSCVWMISIIATIPIAISISSDTRGILDDEDFQKDCIDPCDDDITISPPNDLEFNILNGCTFTMFFALMGVWYLAKRKDSLKWLAPCSAAVLVIAALVSSALFIHVYWYMSLLDRALEELSPLDCYIDEKWQEAYLHADLGLWVGLCVFGIFCCVFYLAFKLKKSIIAALHSDDNVADIQLTKEQAASDVIEKCGFSIATFMNRSVLLRVLSAIEPVGPSALRDTIASSISKMVTLKGFLTGLGVLGHEFVHIVLTDGVDNKSECSLEDIKNRYRQLKKHRYFKSYFIGIDLGSQQKRELQSIVDLAGDAAELFNCDDVSKLSDIFSHITLSLGIEKRVALTTDRTDVTGVAGVASESERVYLKEERHKFLVLFDLDMGASMRGTKWNNLQRALSLFFCNLDKSDIIGCVLFNHETKCITGELLSRCAAKSPIGSYTLKP